MLLDAPLYKCYEIIGERSNGYYSTILTWWSKCDVNGSLSLVFENIFKICKIARCTVFYRKVLYRIKKEKKCM